MINFTRRALRVFSGKSHRLLDQRDGARYSLFCHSLFRVQPILVLHAAMDHTSFR